MTKRFFLREREIGNRRRNVNLENAPTQPPERPSACQILHFMPAIHAFTKGILHFMRLHFLRQKQFQQPTRRNQLFQLAKLIDPRFSIPICSKYKKNVLIASNSVPRPSKTCIWQRHYRPWTRPLTKIKKNN